MPLNAQVDNNQLLLAVICGATSSLFHVVRVRSGRTAPGRPQLQAESAASFASGVLVAWVLNLQTLWTVDPIGAFVSAAVVGFARGPAALLIAAKLAEMRFKLPSVEEPAAPGPESMPADDGEVKP